MSRSRSPVSGTSVNAGPEAAVRTVLGPTRKGQRVPTDGTSACSVGGAGRACGAGAALAPATAASSCSSLRSSSIVIGAAGSGAAIGVTTRSAAGCSEAPARRWGSGESARVVEVTQRSFDEMVTELVAWGRSDNRRTGPTRPPNGAKTQARRWLEYRHPTTRNTRRALDETMRRGRGRECMCDPPRSGIDPALPPDPRVTTST